MIHTRDHQTPYLFDLWYHLGPKRKRLLSESWAGLFREQILAKLPVHKFARFFAEVEVTPPKEVPSGSLQNPSDPDTGYSGHKGQGYPVVLNRTV